MKTFLVVVAALLLTTSLFAQKPLENSLLWRISGKGLKQPSYLYGTIHLICVQDFVLRGQTIEAMNKCQRIAFEIDLLNTKEVTQARQQLVNADPSSYKRWLGEKDYEHLRHFIATTLYVHDTTWTKMRPHRLSLFLIGKSQNCMKTGAEEVVWGISRRDNEVRGYKHEFTGLETLEDRAKLGVFPIESDSSVARQILEGISHWREYQQMFRDIAKLYKSETIVSMQNISEIAPNQFAITKEQIPSTSVIVDARNQLWLPRIEKMALEKPTFFAVGAGHLGGKNGIIMLLRKQGYIVEPITKREQVLGIKK